MKFNIGNNWPLSSFLRRTHFGNRWVIIVTAPPPKLWTRNTHTTEPFSFCGLCYRGVLITWRLLCVINKFLVFLIKNVEYSILHYYGAFYVITAKKIFYPIIPDFMIFFLTKTKVVPLRFFSKCMFSLKIDVHKMDLKNHTFWEKT